MRQLIILDFVTNIIVPVHRITDVTDRSLKEKNIYTVIFLVVAQAFSTEWARGSDTYDENAEKTASQKN